MTEFPDEPQPHANNTTSDAMSFVLLILVSLAFYEIKNLSLFAPSVKSAGRLPQPGQTTSENTFAFDECRYLHGNEKTSPS